ncbi:MAG: DUF1801 domain-containing protein [Phycisphaerales bacterium]|nr:DUF1801 domain-containing protein [Phycisphaerales bacterium]
MKKPMSSATDGRARRGADAIAAYAKAQAPAFRTMCATLRALIDSALPGASSKVWHGSPVWSIDDNPVVGYGATARGVSLLFWNGQALSEPDLKPVGKYSAAQAVFASAEEIDSKVIRRWMEKARSNVFDSKTYFKTMREQARARR